MQANQTCYIHLNNSRLMYIQQPVQLFYAAYVLTKNNPNELLLEVDQDLMKGK
jgi:urease accessory protein UreH